MVERGKLHDYEPETDSLSFIDFEGIDGDPFNFAYAEENGGRDLENWYVDAAAAFLGEAGWQRPSPGTGLTDTEFADVLHVEYQTRGDLFWSWVIDQALAAGFDVYDSETRTELFPAGTRCEGTCCNPNPFDGLDVPFVDGSNS